MASTGDITSYGVYEARWDEEQVRDVRTLRVAAGTSLREHAHEDLLARWVRGTNPGRTRYQPPGRKHALAANLATGRRAGQPKGTTTDLRGSRAVR